MLLPLLSELFHSLPYMLIGFIRSACFWCGCFCCCWSTLPLALLTLEMSIFRPLSAAKESEWEEWAKERENEKAIWEMLDWEFHVSHWTNVDTSLCVCLRLIFKKHVCTVHLFNTWCTLRHFYCLSHRWLLIIQHAVVLSNQYCLSSTNLRTFYHLYRQTTFLPSQQHLHHFLLPFFTGKPEFDRICSRTSFCLDSNCTSLLPFAARSNAINSWPQVICSSLFFEFPFYLNDFSSFAWFAICQSIRAYSEVLLCVCFPFRLTGFYWLLNKFTAVHCITGLCDHPLCCLLLFACSCCCCCCSVK